MEDCQRRPTCKGGPKKKTNRKNKTNTVIEDKFSEIKDLKLVSK